MDRTRRTPWSHTVTVLAAVCLLAALVVPPALFLRWRETRLEELSRPDVQAQWDAFRADMRTQSDRSGPVQRKVPRSPEPPELVWLRDYVLLAVTAWVVFVGVLGSVLLAMVVGVARGRVTSPAPAAPSPPPPGTG